MISGSKKKFFPSAWIGPKTTSQGKSGPKKRFKEVSDLQEVCEKSYRQKSKKIFFAYNFFQRLPRALKPVLNAFLGPIYPQNLFWDLSEHQGRKNFSTPKSLVTPSLWSEKSEAFTNDFGVEKNFFSWCLDMSENNFLG